MLALVIVVIVFIVSRAPDLVSGSPRNGCHQGGGESHPCVTGWLWTCCVARAFGKSTRIINIYMVLMCMVRHNIIIAVTIILRYTDSRGCAHGPLCTRPAWPLAAFSLGWNPGLLINQRAYSKRTVPNTQVEV